MGYEEARIGWCVRDLKGKYFFSRDIIFNEDSSGHLGLPHPFPVASDPSSSLPMPRLPRVRTCTLAGQDFDEVLQLKEFCKVEHARQKSNLLHDVVDGGDCRTLAAVGVQLDVDILQVDGGVHLLSGGAACGVFGDSSSIGDISSMSPVFPAFSPPGLIEDVSLLIENISLAQMEPGIIASFAMHASTSTSTRSSSFDLSKAPLSFAEAHAQSDAPVWRAAMDREKKSLEEMGAFEEADLPPDERAIGLKWVYAFKSDVDGHCKGTPSSTTFSDSDSIPPSGNSGHIPSLKHSVCPPTPSTTP